MSHQLGQRQQQQRATAWVLQNKSSLAVACVASAAAGYLAYKAYNSTGVANTHAALMRAAETLNKLCSGAGDAAETLAQVSNDLRTFLASDADEVPQSLKQLAKLAQCPEVQDTITSCVGAAARAAAGPATDAALAVVDRLLDAALSERGNSLVALAISTAARDGTSSLVTALRDAVQSAYAGQQQQHGSRAAAAAAASATTATGGDALTACMARAVDALQSPAGERLLRAVISSGVGSAGGACMEQISGSTGDLCAPLMAAFSQPENLQALTEVVAALSGACTREMMAVAVGGYGGSGRMRVGTRGQRQQQLEARPLQQQLEPGEQQQQQQQPTASVETAAAVAELVSRLEDCDPLLCASHMEQIVVDATGAGCSSGSSGVSTPHAPETPEPSIAGASPTRRQQQQPFAAALTRRLRDSSAGVIAPRTQSAALATGQFAAVAEPLSWAVAMCAQASQHPELRSLILEASRCSTREAVRALLPSFWTGERSSTGVAGAAGNGSSASGGMIVRAQLQRIQVMISVLLFLVVSVVSPRLIAA